MAWHEAWHICVFTETENVLLFPMQSAVPDLNYGLALEFGIE